MSTQTGDEPPLIGETIARMALSAVPYGGAIDIVLHNSRLRNERRVTKTVEIVEVPGGLARSAARGAGEPSSSILSAAVVMASSTECLRGRSPAVDLMPRRRSL
ncbi:hypothetical protein V6K52_09980 [Knoellia sp. S7-12]|uniref:hypothetical protein n=1 Tax=Knoellia sp. S7-12 TaxID=3126698 RepID=UPI003366542A